MSSLESQITERQPEGWAVVDQLGHRRLVGHVQTIRIGNTVMLEIEQPEILWKDRPGHRPGDKDGARVVLDAHRVTIHPSTIYGLHIVPSRDYCIRAFFEIHQYASPARGPSRWAPDAQTSLALQDPYEYDDEDDEDELEDEGVPF